MKSREWRIERGKLVESSRCDDRSAQCALPTCAARSVLECGDESPLSSMRHAASNQSADVSAHSKTWRQFVVALFCFCVLPSAFCLRASGQSYSIDWHKIAGGGGTSSNGQYTVSGTIGQHDAGGPMTGGHYSLTGGFWAIISVVQTPGAPTLSISHTGNTVKVYWQDVSGWTLQQTVNLAAGNGGWSDSSGVASANGTNSLSLTAPTGNLFFRLTH